MAYRDQVREWASHIQKEFSSYIPDSFSMRIFNSDAPDDVLKMYANLLYESVCAKIDAKKNKSSDIYLVPDVGPDGSVTIIDRISGRVVAGMYMTDSGLPAYYGKMEYLDKIGGRGAYSTIKKEFEDSDYVHDRGTRRSE